MSEPGTHLPQSASLGVLRAAIFAVRRVGAERSRREEGDNGSGGRGHDGASVGVAGQWAFLAIVSLCGGVIVTPGGGDGRGKGLEGSGRREGYSSGSMTNIDEGVLDELLPPQRDGLVTVGTSKKVGGGGALMKMSLDAYVTFLEEVIRGHVVTDQALATEQALGQELGAVVKGVEMKNGGAATSLAEGALTELLRFQVVLQAQQTSPRKVRLPAHVEERVLRGVVFFALRMATF